MNQQSKTKMENMGKVVKKSDYEVYTFTIPISLRGKKRNAFITRELEKNHPCFSQQCCFDSKLKLNKGKFQSIVAVMDKVKLLEYRGKSKCGVTLEGIKNFKFFNGNKKHFIALMIVLLIISPIVFGSLFAGHNEKKTKEEFPVIEKNIGEVNAVPSISAYDFLEKLFQRIKYENGSVLNYRYSRENFSLDDFGTKFSLDVKNTYPERFDFIAPEQSAELSRSFSPVSYQNKEPFFSMSYAISGQNILPSAPLGLDTMASLRSVIEKNGIIISESSEKNSFSLILPEEAFCKFFTDLCNEMQDLGSDVKLLEITGSEHVFNVNIEFCSQEQEKEKSEISLLADFWTLFSERNQTNEDYFENEEAKSEGDLYEAQNQKNGEKIGSIIVKDGRRISYYRDQNGKIKGVEE